MATFAFVMEEAGEGGFVELEIEAAFRFGFGGEFNGFIVGRLFDPRVQGR
jgi:hypothetical protein